MSNGIQIFYPNGAVQLDSSDSTARIVGQARLEFAAASSGTQTASATFPGLLSTDTLILNVYENQRVKHDYSISGTTVTVVRTSHVYSQGASSVILIFVRVV